MSQEYESPEETGGFKKNSKGKSLHRVVGSPFRRIENPFSRIAISSLDLNRSFSRIAIRSLDFNITSNNSRERICNPRERKYNSRKRITNPRKRITIP